LKQFADLGDGNNENVARTDVGQTYLNMAKDTAISVEKRKETLQHAVTYLHESLLKSKELGRLDIYQQVSALLSEAYELNKDFDKALSAYKEYTIYKDSVFNKQKSDEITKKQLQYDFGKREDSIKYQQAITAGLLKQQTLTSNTQQQALLINRQQLALANRQKALQKLTNLKTEADLKANQSRLKISEKEEALTQSNLQLQQTELNSKRAQSRYFIGGLLIMVVLTFFIALNYVNQRKANGIIVSANKEIAIQKSVVENSLHELKITQDQLIQAEKMASLGELTSGIAHEIQNPLNFVNNFSEVNTELISEIFEQIEKGDLHEIKLLACDLQENEKKINSHGKRADNIVKGMLQHSKSSGGKKEPTNINSIVEESMRLAYTGFAAREKSFYADMINNFDSQLPLILLTQQDFGRVLLNIFSNAFYAIDQKIKIAGPGYKPKVLVTTIQHYNSVLIKIKDNGTGIPAAIKEKIMQPFFTTKPTGEFTGLGLSLSYDIITKGNGGKFDVISDEGEGAEFIITIPLHLKGAVTG